MNPQQYQPGSLMGLNALVNGQGATFDQSAGGVDPFQQLMMQMMQPQQQAAPQPVNIGQQLHEALAPYGARDLGMSGRGTLPDGTDAGSLFNNKNFTTPTGTGVRPGFYGLQSLTHDKPTSPIPQGSFMQLPNGGSVSTPMNNGNSGMYRQGQQVLPDAQAAPTKPVMHPFLQGLLDYNGSRQA